MVQFEVSSFKVLALPGIGVTFAQPVAGLQEMEIRTEEQAEERLSDLDEYINGLSRLNDGALNAGGFLAGFAAGFTFGSSTGALKAVAEKEACLITAQKHAIKQREEIGKLRFQEGRLVSYVE